MKMQSSSSMRVSSYSQACGPMELLLMRTRSNSVTPGRASQANNSNTTATSNASTTTLIQSVPNSSTGLIRLSTSTLNTKACSATWLYQLLTLPGSPSFWTCMLHKRRVCSTLVPPVLVRPPLSRTTSLLLTRRRQYKPLLTSTVTLIQRQCKSSLSPK